MDPEVYFGMRVCPPYGDDFAADVQRPGGVEVAPPMVSRGLRRPCQRQCCHQKDSGDAPAGQPCVPSVPRFQVPTHKL
jgi:hypothetical protein